ncbi:MAG: HAD hydrolase-like protein [Planctomycetota bacterium]|nr:HAD hydrolase-like protein [Planctomycetota bacterium]
MKPVETVDTHRAWLIDLDGTLYHALPVKVCMAAELVFAGPRVWRIISYFRAAHEELRQLAPQSENDEPTCSFERQISIAANRAGCDFEIVRRTVLKWMFEKPGRWLRLFRRRRLLEEIRRHHESGGKTALVSDYPARQKLDALGITSLFDHVVANGEVNPPVELKPAPAGYLRAAELLGVAVEECVVLGDRSDADGKAAKAAGMMFRHVAR